MDDEDTDNDDHHHSIDSGKDDLSLSIIMMVKTIMRITVMDTLMTLMMTICLTLIIISTRLVLIISIVMTDTVEKTIILAI